MNQPLKKQKSLLIIENDPATMRLLFRVSCGKFDEMYPAFSKSDADDILKNHLITHLVCNDNLDRNEFSGFKNIQQWRETYSHIEKAILFTTNPNSILTKPKHIDHILSKTSDLEEIKKVICD